MEINGHEQFRKTTDIISESDYEYKAKLLSTLADKAMGATKLGEPIGIRIAEVYLSAADLVKNKF